MRETMYERALNRHQRGSVAKTMAMVAAAAVLLALVAWLALHFDARARIVAVLEWIDGLGAWGPLCLIAIDAMVVILVLPGVMLTLGAGFLFGVAEGCLYIVVGTSIGATGAFLIARYLLGRRVARYLLRHPKARLLDGVLARSGWKFVLATRLIPFFPFKVANYAFGLSHFSLRDYIVGTVVGIIPFTLTNVYIGSLAADLATLGVRDGTIAPWEWVLYGAGLTIAVGVTVYLARVARHILNTEIDQAEASRPCRG